MKRPLVQTLACTFVWMMAATASAQTSMPAFTLPDSNQLSAEARAVFAKVKQGSAPANIATDIQALRVFYGKGNDTQLAAMRQHFRTVERRETMNGVPVDVVEPSAGIPAGNAHRVLINVHGGAFMWGSGSGALVEAIPIAVTMGIKVVTVDYRLAPEHRYPAASEDVTAVYRALLQTYLPENIGIYGCSAGGVITAQVIPWIRRQNLPRPAAIGTFCGTGAPISGDSAYLAGPLMGTTMPVVPVLPDVLDFIYMQGVPATDGAAYPMMSDEEVRQMPPTMLLAGGRDFAVSMLTLAHRRLAAAGVESDLQIFDGLSHAFFVWPEMPESHEAYRLIASFFDRHLGRRAR